MCQHLCFQLYMPQPTKGTKICVDLALLGMSSLHNCTTQAACKKGFAKSAGAWQLLSMVWMQRNWFPAGRPGNQKKLVSCAAVCGQNWFPGWLVLGFGRSEKCVQMRSILLNIFGFLAHIFGFLTQSCAGGFWFFYWLQLFFLDIGGFFGFRKPILVPSTHHLHGAQNQLCHGVDMSVKQLIWRVLIYICIVDI